MEVTHYQQWVPGSDQRSVLIGLSNAAPWAHFWIS